jgi:hypothetical protein
MHTQRKIHIKRQKKKRPQSKPTSATLILDFWLPKLLSKPTAVEVC